MHKHTTWLFLGLPIAYVGCTGALSEESRPCPCVSGWTCCQGANVCVRDGVNCPGADSGTMNIAENDSGDATQGDGAGPPLIVVGNDSGDATGQGDGADAADGSAGVDIDATTPLGLARFAFIVNGVVQTPVSCPSSNWQFMAVAGGAEAGAWEGGVGSALIKNTGPVPIAYVARPIWFNDVQHYVPGVSTGNPNELVGVVDPQNQVDITSAFNGGIVALLGSADPFSSPDAGRYAFDEGTIPWPAGVRGSGGATQMWLAEIEMYACKYTTPVW